MNIFLLGATGRVGSVILDNLLEMGHTVHALVRNPEKIKLSHPRLQIFQGDASNSDDVSLAMESCQAVLSSLNTGGATVLSTSMPLILSSMESSCIKKIIMISTAGILQARVAPELYRFQSSESKRTSSKDAEEHLRAFLILKQSGLDWTVVCPTYLPVGERIGIYRIEKEFLPINPSSISIYDTADFACSQLDSNEFIHSRVGLTY